MVTKRTSAPPRNPVRGFTLIELILVLVIIGFLTSLVAPAITSKTGLQLKTSAKRVAAGLRLARSQAVIEERNYRVTFTLESGEMLIECPGETHVPWQDAGKEEDEETAPKKRTPAKKRYRLPRGVTLAKVVQGGEEITEENAVIDFYPNGSCTGGDIFISDTRERTYRIALDFLTGIVTVGEEEED